RALGALAHDESDRVGVRDDPPSQRSRQGLRDACDDAGDDVQTGARGRAELPQIEGLCASGKGHRWRALRRWCRENRGSRGQQSRRLIRLRTPELTIARDAMTCNVLVVDDDKTVLSILSATLTGAGYRCHETNKPDDALAAVAKNESISVVVSDIYMPGMTGFEFVDRLGALPLSRPCPRILLLTAQPSLQSVVDALRLGACDFLTKPVSASDLINAVKRAMDRAAQDRSDYASPMARVERLIKQSRDLTEHLRSRAASGEASAPVVPVMQGTD